MSWSDEQLCDHLEGLLPAADAGRLEAELEKDDAEGAALAARLSALRAILAPPVLLPEVGVPAEVEQALHGLLEPDDATDSLAGPVTLPPVEVPADLAAWVGATARGEEPDLLVEPVVLPAVPVPPGLEGWVRDAARAATAAEAPAGRLVTLAWVTATRLAAMLLVAIGLGLAAGVGLTSAGRVAGDPALLGDLERARRELAQVRAEATRATERLSAAARERDAALARAEAGARDLGAARAELGAARAELASARDGLRGELERTRAELARAGGDLTPLQEALAASREALAEARAGLSASATRAEALAAELAAARAPAVVAVRTADGVERWDDHTRDWTPLRAGERLAQGTFVRGVGAGSRVDAGRALPVGRGLFVVGHAGLAPVPASVDGPQASAAVVPAERPASATPWASVLPGPPGLRGGRD